MNNFLALNMQYDLELAVLEQSKLIDSFKFNNIGELIAKPDFYTLYDLELVHSHLISIRQYISASRINHLIQCEAINQ